MKANPAYIRNEAGQYQCLCACGALFWADAPHARYHTRKCRNKARLERIHAVEPLKRKGKKLNNCLGHGCSRKVSPPLHFCPRCRENRAKNPIYSEEVWRGSAL